MCQYTHTTSHHRASTPSCGVRRRRRPQGQSSPLWPQWAAAIGRWCRIRAHPRVREPRSRPIFLLLALCFYGYGSYILGPSPLRYTPIRRRGCFWIDTFRTTTPYRSAVVPSCVRCVVGTVQVVTVCWPLLRYLRVLWLVRSLSLSTHISPPLEVCMAAARPTTAPPCQNAARTGKPYLFSEIVRANRALEKVETCAKTTVKSVGRIATAVVSRWHCLGTTTGTQGLVASRLTCRTLCPPAARVCCSSWQLCAPMTRKAGKTARPPPP